MTALHKLRWLTNRLRRLPGTHPPMEFLRRMAYGVGPLTINDFDGDLTMSVDLGEHMGGQIFWFGYYARDELMAINRILRPGMVVVDVGANMGEVTLFCAKRVGGEGKVFSFEPDERIHPMLLENIRANGLEQVVPVKAGLSDRSGTQQIYIRSEKCVDGSVHRGLGTLYRTDARAEPGGMVTLMTLDEFVRAQDLSRVDLIKLDIEGAELPALRGASRTLERFRPWIVVEVARETSVAARYEPGDVLRFIHAFGYQTSIIGRKGKLRPASESTLGDWQNVLCIPPNGPT